MHVNGLEMDTESGGFIAQSGAKIYLEALTMSGANIDGIIHGTFGTGHVVAAHHGAHIIYDTANTPIVSGPLTWWLAGTPTAGTDWTTGDAFDAAEVDNRVYDDSYLA